MPASTNFAKQKALWFWFAILAIGVKRDVISYPDNAKHLTKNILSSYNYLSSKLKS